MVTVETEEKKVQVFVQVQYNAWWVTRGRSVETEWSVEHRNNKCHFSDGTAWILTMSIPNSSTLCISIEIGLRVEKWIRTKQRPGRQEVSTATVSRWAVYYFEHWSCSKSEFEKFPNPEFLFQLITSNVFTTNENEYYGPFNAPFKDLSCFRVLSGCSSFQAYSWLYRLHCNIPDEKFSSCEVKPLLAYDLDSSR